MPGWGSFELDSLICNSFFGMFSESRDSRDHQSFFIDLEVGRSREFLVQSLHSLLFSELLYVRLWEHHICFVFSSFCACSSFCVWRIVCCGYGNIKVRCESVCRTWGVDNTRPACPWAGKLLCAGFLLLIAAVFFEALTNTASVDTEPSLVMSTGSGSCEPLATL